MLRLLAIGVVIALMHGEAQAADVQFAMYGVGGSTCGDYLNARRQPNSTYDAVIAQWVWGFVTASNLHLSAPHVSATISQASIVAYLDKYCRDHPLDNLLLGVQDLQKAIAK